MIKNIIDLLQIAKGQTENIRIAQGKYKLSETFSEAIKQTKTNIIDLLQIAKGQTENIRIAQGKYKLSETFSEAIKQTKTNIIWRKK